MIETIEITKIKISLKERMTNLLEVLREGLYERDEIMGVCLLSALSEQNIFLYGPPGTAKSLISRRLSMAFKTKNYFEHLMQRFSTPEEVFGPISISELKKDNYLRKTEGYLPEAEFAFLDEIWKSSPAILNTLLTIINEKTFKNGSDVKNVPLKVLISASNEIPKDNQGLDALYDRFLTRLQVCPLENRMNFETILQNGSTVKEVEIEESLKVNQDEWQIWKNEIDKIILSEDTLNIINGIRLEIEKRNQSKDIIYVSDRRWQRAARLLKTSAFFCDRKSTNIVDCLLLSHVLWSKSENCNEVEDFVESIIKTYGFETRISLLALDEEKDSMEKEIHKEFYYSKDVYKTVQQNGNTYFKCKIDYYDDNQFNRKPETITFLIPYKNLKTNIESNPLDEDGNILEWIKCKFGNQGVCNIKVNCDGRRNVCYLNDRSFWKGIKQPFKPSVLFHTGDKKDDINERLVVALMDDVNKLKSKIDNTLIEVEQKKEALLVSIKTPFLSEKKQRIVLTSVQDQIEELSLRSKDCERLMSLVQ